MDLPIRVAGEFRPQSIAVLLVGAAVLAGCNTSSESEEVASTGGESASESAVPLPGPTPTIAGQASWSASESAAFNDLFITAREDRGWRLMWQLVGEEPPGELPENAMAVGVFLGARPTLGYDVDVLEILQTEDDIRVVYQETVPDGVAATQLSAPYVIELAPFSNLPVHYSQP